jgi:TolB-like protein
MSNPPTTDELRVALRRILDSEAFISAPRSRAFLEFIVTEVVEGRSHRIKEGTVARYALGREALDAGDPAVRVQATRVRAALERYYADQGRGDEIRIELPRGSYVPVFSRTVLTGDLEPGILVATLAPHQDPIARGLSESLVHALGAFPGIRVGGPTVVADPLGAARRYAMRYVLAGSVRESHDELRILVRLTDAASGEVVWSQRFEEDVSRLRGFAAEDALVRRVAGAVGDFRGVAVRRGGGDARAFTAMQAYYRYLDRTDRGNLDAAIDALDSVGATDSSLMTAILGHCLAVRAVMRWCSDPASDTDRAHHLGAQALHRDPGVALGHLALATVAYDRDDRPACLDHARRAIALCRWHPSTLYYSGALLTLAGAWDEGIAAIAEANRLNPLHPVYQSILPGIHYLLSGKPAEAVREVPPGAQPLEERGNLVRALAFHRLGDDQRAEAELKIALTAEPRLLDNDCSIVVDEYRDLPLGVRVALRRELLAFLKPL